jgi:predicted DNA-binding transcriptional regulator AlpA
MPSATPLFASERRAAQLLDMSPAQFRDLVEAGALPPPCAIAGTVRRWDVEELQAIMRGAIPRVTQDLDL